MIFTHHSVTQTVPSNALAVSVLEAKQQLHLDVTEDDLAIDAYIRTATAYCEHYTQRCFLKSQYTAFYHHLSPVTSLPFPPSMPSFDPIVEFLDDGDVWQEVDPAAYYYDAAVHPAVIARADCQLWPCVSSTCYPSRPRYRITWWAGYGESGKDIPLLARQAILLLTAHYYERRLASDNFSTTEIPFGVKQLLDSVRWRFYS